MNTARNPGRRAFTLTELIAVITIIVILLAVSIPTFRSTIAASDASNVETQLRLALLSARNAALHSERGADTAAVFTFQPGGKTNILICEHVGTFVDRTSPTRGVARDVFVPVPAFEPVQLTAGWMVSGLVPAGTLAPNSNPGWYEDASGRSFDTDQRNWVFPETEFFDARRVDDGGNRQTFMIRFVGGVGSVAVGDDREALIVSPRVTALGRDRSPYQDVRVDATTDLSRTVRQAINNRSYLLANQGSSAGDPLTNLFGDVSGDTILARTVEQIALYKSTDLANGLGIKLNRDTGIFYADNADAPEIDVRGDTAAFHNRLRWWIEGNTTAARSNRDDAWIIQDDDDTPVARLYTVQRYTGVLQPVPLLDLAGANR